jgi:hypothetical protein
MQVGQIKDADRITRLCKDCEHYDPFKCMHPQVAGKPDLVWGITPHPFAAGVRAQANLCGPSGSLFAPRKVSFVRWLRHLLKG